MSEEACCAHIRVSYRTEDVDHDFGPLPADHKTDPNNPHVPAFGVQRVTRGWWECDSGCGARFGVIPRAAAASVPSRDATDATPCHPDCARTQGHPAPCIDMYDRDLAASRAAQPRAGDGATDWTADEIRNARQAAGALASSPPSTPRESPDETSALRARIAELEDEVAKLRPPELKRIESLQDVANAIENGAAFANGARSGIANAIRRLAENWHSDSSALRSRIASLGEQPDEPSSPHQFCDNLSMYYGIAKDQRERLCRICSELRDTKTELAALRSSLQETRAERDGLKKCIIDMLNGGELKLGGDVPLTGDEEFHERLKRNRLRAAAHRPRSEP